MFRAVGVLFVVLLFAAGAPPVSAALRDGDDQSEQYPYGWVEDELLVQFGSPVVPALAERLAFGQRHGLRERSFAPGINWFRFRATAHGDLDALMRHVAQDPSVVRVTKNAIGRMALLPDDPYYGSQWGLPKVRMPQAWNVAGGGPTKYLAVVDSGVANGRGANQHPDLGPIFGWNFVADNNHVEDNCFDDLGDEGGHGTWVAGIAAAFTDNSIGIAGVNYAAPILAVKMTDNCFEANAGAAAEGIRYAVDNGASVITASWDFTGSDAQYAMLRTL